MAWYSVKAQGLLYLYMNNCTIRAIKTVLVKKFNARLECGVYLGRTKNCDVREQRLLANIPFVVSRGGRVGGFETVTLQKNNELRLILSET
jgi:hypothetical protein